MREDGRETCKEMVNSDVQYSLLPQLLLLDILSIIGLKIIHQAKGTCIYGRYKLCMH